MTTDQNITISRKEYEELMDDSLILNCLRNGGVDNWEWYGTAMEEYHSIKENE